MSAAHLAVVVAVCTLLASGCGADQSASSSPPRPSATPSACDRAFLEGREAEAAGTPSFTAFLSSVQTCRSLREWTMTSRRNNAPIHGQEAVFVSNVCAEADAKTRASEICVVADRLFRDGG